MGNCLRRESRMSYWAGDDWGSLGGSKSMHHHHQTTMHVFNHEVEKQRLLHGIGASSSSSPSFSSSSSSSPRELKIRIKKKEVDQILARITTERSMQGGISVEEFVSQLLINGAVGHQRSWRPALHSIPEVN